MTDEQAYQLALMIYRAGERGEPLPEVPEQHRKTAERLWRSARRAARIQ